MRAVLAERLNGLSGRARRAVALMLVAAVSVGAISMYYLRPWTAFQASLATRPVSVVPTPGIGYLTNYHFVSTALGWSVVITTNAITNSQDGSYWVYKTVDAGRHWQRQLAGRTARSFVTFDSLWFANARTGYVVAGDPVMLYSTHDGGDHWAKTTLSVPDIQQVRFVDEADGFVITSSPTQIIVNATHDGGETWNKLPDSPSNRAFWPQFRSPAEAWSGATDSRPYVYLTLDGGATWSHSLLPMPSDLHGQVSTWVDVQPPGPLVFAYLNVEKSLLAYSSVDHGKSWNVVTLPSPNTVNPVALVGIDLTHWWALQDDSTLYRTDDGGKSWARVGPQPLNLRLVKVIDSGHAWGVQDISDGMGPLMLTSDGGLSWDKRTSPKPL